MKLFGVLPSGGCKQGQEKQNNKPLSPNSPIHSNLR